MLAELPIAAQTRRTNPTIAWAIVLIFSLLPNILWRELVAPNDGWMLWSKFGLLGALLAASFFLKSLQPLRSFIVILLALYAAEELVSRAAGLPFWQSWFHGSQAGFTRSMLGQQLERLVVSLVMILVLLGLGLKRKDFFLTLGNLRAPITPVRWLGFPKADPWTRFGGQFAIYISLGLLAFLILGGRPTFASLALALPMLPVVLVLAALNAFNEEMTYRASLISTLEGPIGPQGAVMVAAAFFGIGHFYGVPYGILGVAMATFLGWLLGKAMVETRGFFWAWLIHFLQDVLIFSFMAIGSITPGG
jgi:membrane protease YdiL (CAAX protease family)